MFRLVRFVIALVLATAVHSGGITWMPVAYDKLIETSELIVVGRIETVADTAHEDGWTACGTLNVTEVLKGTPPADGVHLDYPSNHPAAFGGAEAEPAPAEVVYEKGQTGIWFLFREQGQVHYTAAHPARFKPMPFLSRIKSEIAKAAAR